MTDNRQPEEKSTEADAQKAETVMPMIWMALGLLVVVAFVAFMVMGPSNSSPGHPVVAPSEAPVKPVS